MTCVIRRQDVRLLGRVTDQGGEFVGIAQEKWCEEERDFAVAAEEEDVGGSGGEDFGHSGIGWNV